MARKRRKSPAVASPEPTAKIDSATADREASTPESDGPRRLDARMLWAAVIGLLALHYSLAASSLVRENPTVDEIAHLPAGVTYWERGTFRLYPHNPPLVKLVAAAPVVLAGPETAELYQQNSWIGESPSQANVGQNFAYFNAPRYFELFDLARLTIPLFTVLGGLGIFFWSRRIHGDLGGLTSLALWCLCPNILAHGRLVTSDAAGASLALLSTFGFLRFLDRPTWGRAAAAGILLGLAQLTKFSLLLLYGYWPLLWLLKRLFEGRAGWSANALVRNLMRGGLMVALSVLVIDIGYGFERVGEPLGRFEFCSKTLTRPIEPGSKPRPRSRNELLDRAWRHRENRFRGTVLESLPVPLPYHYLAGFDEQKIESEGLPLRWFEPTAPADAVTGYSVYLDGVMKKSGWWYYYLATLAYKLPEGTWLLIVAGLVGLVGVRGRAEWFDAVAVLLLPGLVLFAMSALTDINLGLRYILPVLPFLYVAAGRTASLMAMSSRVIKRIGTGLLVVGVAATALSTASIHPHYLAYFNWISGGPDRGAAHLIDSNLDWGQDLVGLQRYMAEKHPGEPVGLVYFGQINPHIFRLRGEAFDWFMPPPLPGTTQPMYRGPSLLGPRPRLTPGLYAVSASIVKGLPWRLYDPGLPPQANWAAAWNAGQGAYSYFDSLTPIAKVGWSIFVYRLDAADCERINTRFAASSN